MTKLGLLKDTGEYYPYVPQCRSFFGRWKTFQRPSLLYPYQRDAEYETREEAEEAINNFIERKNRPAIVKEIEG